MTLGSLAGIVPPTLAHAKSQRNQESSLSNVFGRKTARWPFAQPRASFCAQRAVVARSVGDCVIRGCEHSLSVCFDPGEAIP